jgi:hypothetical protein
MATLLVRASNRRWYRTDCASPAHCKQTKVTDQLGTGAFCVLETERRLECPVGMVARLCADTTTMLSCYDGYIVGRDTCLQCDATQEQPWRICAGSHGSSCETDDQCVPPRTCQPLTGVDGTVSGHGCQ